MKRTKLSAFRSLLLLLFSISAAAAFSTHGLTATEAARIRRRQLLAVRDGAGGAVIPPSFSFPNDHLRDAFIALQAWKQAIFSDPKNFTGDWRGPNVCGYSNVYCAPLPSNQSVIVVAGIDLNHGDIAGYLPEELGLLTDLALFHINSNRFCGIVPRKLDRLKLLFELDLSNNRFVGKFPDVVLRLPSLKFLDLRFNEFEGTVPSELFDKDLDAIFINDNRFVFEIPNNLGNSPVSVIVLANNKFHGCVPASIGNMKRRDVNGNVGVRFGQESDDSVCSLFSGIVFLVFCGLLSIAFVLAMFFAC
ncbi:hypothetical protein J5N97_013340 [Dioscorea zingiberensis]|uniref:Cell wall hydroxyproline-rich glycoprotein n=1 Tax=Dioscorea zingiberensis TaxID=325984 RepID=A0A9D5HIJ0_9LILI|nr:hypothetical protein J5N97_013340 [Dioscorea zingiberensis]